NLVWGTADATGSFTGQFVAAPEAMNVWAGAAHAFAYVVAASPNFETDRRFVLGTTPIAAQPLRLHAMRDHNTPHPASITIASTDPVYQAVDTDPTFVHANIVCRSIRLHVTTDGMLSVNAVPVGSIDYPIVELDLADESDVIAWGQAGTVSQLVHAGDV